MSFGSALLLCSISCFMTVLVVRALLDRRIQRESNRVERWAFNKIEESRSEWFVEGLAWGYQNGYLTGKEESQKDLDLEDELSMMDELARESEVENQD